MIELQESSLHPGGVVRLSADFVWETCEDTGGTSRAASDVTVSVTPSATGEELVLARPTPEGERSTVSGSFDLPADLPLGDAVLAVRSHSGDAFEAELPIAITARPSSRREGGLPGDSGRGRGIASRACPWGIAACRIETIAAHGRGLSDIVNRRATVE